MADASQRLTVRLTQAQRKVIAEIAPELAARLKLGEKLQRTVPFTLAELRAIKEKAGRAIQHASTGMVRNPLRCVQGRLGKGVAIAACPDDTSAPSPWPWLGSTMTSSRSRNRLMPEQTLKQRNTLISTGLTGPSGQAGPSECLQDLKLDDLRVIIMCD